MSQADVSELIFFGSNVSIMRSFTGNKRLLQTTLSLPFSRGSTALFEAIVFGLNELHRLDDKYLKALVVFTDGRDTASSRSLDEMVAVAASSAIPIFTIGVGEADAEVLQQISRRSKGVYSYASNTAALESIYNSISKILRESYVLSYPSSAKSGDKVEVEITAPLKDKRSIGKFSGHYLVP